MKVGDRVVVTSDSAGPGLVEGMKGVVLRAYDASPAVLVDFPGWELGHSGDDFDGVKSKYWVPMSRIEVVAVDDTNPKDLVGRTKVDLSLVPPVFVSGVALAFMDGAAKYGPYNWRSKKVGARTYVSACLRHLFSWLDGEEFAADSGHHHLHHAAACIAIICDAQENGTLVDDRPLPGGAARFFEEANQKNLAKANGTGA